MNMKCAQWLLSLLKELSTFSERVVLALLVYHSSFN
jgi:hypothetical protein